MYQFINRNSYFGRYSCLSSLASTGPRPFQLRGIWVSNLLYYWIGKYLRYRKCPLLCLDKLVITARTKEDIFLPFLFNSFFLRFKIFFSFLSFIFLCVRLLYSCFLTRIVSLISFAVLLISPIKIQKPIFYWVVDMFAEFLNW